MEHCVQQRKWNLFLLKYHWQVVLKLPEGQSGLLTGFPFCQMVSFLFGFTALFPPLSESLLGLKSVGFFSGRSTEGEEQRGNILSVWENKRKYRKSRGCFGCLALVWEQGEHGSSPLSRAHGCSFADTLPRTGTPVGDMVGPAVVWPWNEEKDVTSSLKGNNHFPSIRDACCKAAKCLVGLGKGLV